MAGLDVDSMFRQFSVPKIREIEKQVKGDIETKKEDLRQMVGRRYRDIIEAADNIRDMKQMADHIMTSIRDVQNGFDKLQLLQQQLVTAQQRAHLKGHGKVDSELVRDTQLKLLLDVPELIWECLDADSPDTLLPAIWCLLLAENVRHGLMVQLPEDAGDKRSLLDRQTRQLRKLRIAVTEQCDRIFRAVDLETSQSALLDELCAMALLENASISDVLGKFLCLRKDYIVTLFKESDCSSREQMSRCAATIQNTILAVFNVFVPPSGGRESALLHSLRNAVQGEWQPVVFAAFVEEQSRTFKNALPNDVRHFHPDYKAALTDMTSAQLQKACSHWLQESLSVGRNEIVRLVDFCESIDSISALKKSVIETLNTQEPWSVASTAAVGAEFSVYDALIKASLLNRLKTLINETVTGIFDMVGTAIDKEIKLETSPNAQFWLELPSDTVNICSPKDSTIGASNLTLRARAVSPSVYSLCHRVDSQLNALSQALQRYLEVEKETADGDLRAAVSQACSSAVERFGGTITAGAWQARPNNDLPIEGLMRRGRLCLGLCELCPGLKNCLQLENKVKTEPANRRSRDDERGETWITARSALTDAAIACYLIWADHAVNVVSADVSLQDMILSAKRAEEWILSAQEWEVIDIEEETESGRKVASSILVPLQLSRYAHRFLNELTRVVSIEGAHRLPKVVRQRLAGSAWSAFDVAYQRLLSDTSGIGQRQAVQLLFDVKSLNQLLMPEEGSKSMAKLVERLESLIDPFDLDVLNAHMRRNVVKMVQRSAAIFGGVLPTEAMSAAGRASGSKPSGGAEQPQLLPVTASIARFNLLPVAAPTLTGGHPNAGGQPLNSSISADNAELKKRHEPSIAPIKSASTASTKSFYDKISTSWFGNT
uniref:Conserved oligomeric Golgi complex subunit 1 n=1 Tax=Plectus sambesii TaxID=2011161 RepID=A0A914UU69_9BILA